MKTAGAPPQRGGSSSSSAVYFNWSSSSCSYDSCRVLVVKMGGKSKKPHQSSSFKESEPEPPRIKSNVKHNLQLLKLWKEFQSRGSGMAKPATSYRKKKVEKDELPDDSELYRDPTNTLYYTNQGLLDDAVPVLLVDGYNVCGYWMKLKKHFMKGRLDVARQKLVDELVSFSMVKEVKVVVVFDALMSGLPTHKEDFAGVDVIFSGETCADAWIEKEARKNDLFTPKACSNRRLYENNC
ncbi:yacP-like NYN domain protein [Arabidopsis thaliana]|uniref:YacP-like NYN domain protein n=2 Tax=Arabidopsis thaliana TaxID=3702 RepID=A0A1P8AYR9_ARATH|nr:yacP-like NYN domain protein [Arabidopsis thaliana]NP_001324003.1 yacP-like NYN domain protein [Arabidopsis thaliana]ANM61799.1 yacP-like NYN domain protein [Arabidopsis thaliana]ANM61806.1 yacP-like NYN domain protein [Arabidopsis thaliana]|eukprot:NP_001323996.1 yacP-like NYN domain protein [Arabidopsis thaliana]